MQTQLPKPNQTIFSAAKRFHGYKDEELTPSRFAKVMPIPVLERMMEAWEGFQYAWGPSQEFLVSQVGNNDEKAIFAYLNDPESDFCYGYNRSNVLALMKGEICSPEDISTFMKAMVMFENESQFNMKAGVMLSALIEQSGGGFFQIPTRHLSSPIFSLGHKNTIRMEVFGNAGSLLGERMIGGVIIVHGHTGQSVGEGMTGGVILVKGYSDERAGYNLNGGCIVIMGSAGNDAGKGMRGGKLLIRGDADRNLGDQMNGGEIHVEGDILSLGFVYHGRIFHKGRLIIDK